MHRESNINAWQKENSLQMIKNKLISICAKMFKNAIRRITGNFTAPRSINRIGRNGKFR